MSGKVILLLAFISLAAGAATIRFHEHSNYGGPGYFFFLHSHDCYDMPDWFNDKASSVSTHGSCILVFEHSDCGGRWERIEPGTPHHANLGQINFNDMVSSIRLC